MDDKFFWSDGWTEYVKSKLKDDDVFEGNPKVDGLWRVAEEILGLIEHYESEVCESPSERNAFGATVKVSLTVRLNEAAATKLGVKILTSSGLADCSLRNAEGIYARFPSALAETRAKGRALRTLLRLQNVVVAEELAPEEADDNNELIKDEQITMIDTLCERTDINVAALIKGTCAESKYNFTKLKDTHRFMALKIIKKLRTLQDDKNNIPKELKGYIKDWRK
jgi:hypothetical protein